MVWGEKRLIFTATAVILLSFISVWRENWWGKRTVTNTSSGGSVGGKRKRSAGTMPRSRRPQRQRAWKIGKKFSRKPQPVSAFIRWKPNGSKNSDNSIGSVRIFILNTSRRAYQLWQKSKRTLQTAHLDPDYLLLRCREKILQGHLSSTWPYHISDATS